MEVDLHLTSPVSCMCSPQTNRTWNKKRLVFLTNRETSGSFCAFQHRPSVHYQSMSFSWSDAFPFTWSFFVFFSFRVHMWNETPGVLFLMLQANRVRSPGEELPRRCHGVPASQVHLSTQAVSEQQPLLSTSPVLHRTDWPQLLRSVSAGSVIS